MVTAEKAEREERYMLTFRLSESERERLEAYAKDHDLTRAQVLRRLVRENLPNDAGAKKVGGKA